MADNTSYSNIEKVAIIISSLDEETAAQVLKNMSPLEIQMVTHSMAQMENISSNSVRAVYTEFLRLVDSGESLIEGGADRTRKILTKALGQEQATHFIENLDSGDPTLSLSSIDMVGNLDPKILADFTKGEHPQTMAIILANLPPDKAAAVLSHFGQEMKQEVLSRIAELKQVPSDVLREVADVIRKEVQVSAGMGKEMGGAKPVAEILNQMDSSSEKQVLSFLEEENPTLAEEIRKLMFVFEDLANIDDRGIQQLLREIDSKTLSVALRAASDEIKDKFLKNMSERAAEMLTEDMETMGPTRLSEIEQSQQEIIRVAKRLEEEGKLVVGGKGSDEVFI